MGKRACGAAGEDGRVKPLGPNAGNTQKMQYMEKPERCLRGPRLSSVELTWESTAE